MNRFFLGAYWSGRKESIDKCVDRLLSFFGDLVKCDDTLAQWYELANSRKKALEKCARVESREYLLRQLKRGRHSLEDLGFTFGLWNGGDEANSVGLSITCGSYHATLGNCVTLELPEDLGGLGDFRQMVAVLAAVAKAWEPDWAGVASEEAKRRRKFDASRPFVDWMLYISDRWLPNLPDFKPPASIERLPAGTMIIVQQGPPDPDNPTHLESIQQVRNALRGRVKIEALATAPRRPTA